MPPRRAAVSNDTNTPPEFVYITKNGVKTRAEVLHRHPGEAYVHYEDTDKRMDEWVPEDTLSEVEPNAMDVASTSDGPKAEAPALAGQKRKCNGLMVDGRSNGHTALSGNEADGEDDTPAMTEEEIDLREHKKIGAKKNFDRVYFGTWQIKTWYFSPYPMSDAEVEDLASNTSEAGTSVASASTRIHNVARSSLRAHGRTSDILAGGLNRDNTLGAKAVLWVCDKCFKYMSQGAPYELHYRNCCMRHPPGRKVYQRGAHTIWEVDGAKSKLFCQNLSLFGKLFIDIKTLFFDTEHFLFYVLTDAAAQRDHVLGFFSKEKVSYDDYNLACIVTLPPYQRKGYGMMMIEFSYELSRRAGRMGTPERPLSDLGLRSYLAYWVATLVRFFRRLLSVSASDISLSPRPGDSSESESISSQARTSDDMTRLLRRKKISNKGWDGELDSDILGDSLYVANRKAEDELFMRRLRVLQTTSNPDGSATTHVVCQCTLADLSQATYLRVEDVAFALNECGLLQYRKAPAGTEDDDQSERDEQYIVISRTMVEEVAARRKVKQLCILDLNRVIL